MILQIVKCVVSFVRQCNQVLQVSTADFSGLAPNINTLAQAPLHDSGGHCLPACTVIFSSTGSAATHAGMGEVYEGFGGFMQERQGASTHHLSKIFFIEGCMGDGAEWADAAGGARGEVPGRE